MAGCILAPLTAADLPTLAALHGLCFPADPWDSTALAALWRLKGAWSRAAWREDAPAGFIMARCDGEEGEILTLCVRPELRRRGIAQALLDALMSEVEQLGVAAIYLEVAEDNSAALALYDAAGFRQVGRRAAYYRRSASVSVDARVLRRAVP